MREIKEIEGGFRILGDLEEALICEVKLYFNRKIEISRHSCKLFLPRHVNLVEDMANEIIAQSRNYGRFKDICEFSLRMAITLHDIGHILKKEGEGDDHAVISELRAEEFLLSKNVSNQIISRTCQIIRSHRNNDVKPEIDEARILVAADSASHLVDVCYIDMFRKFSKKEVREKLERDMRDLEIVREEIRGTAFWRGLVELGKNWLGILDNYPDFLVCKN